MDLSFSWNEYELAHDMTTIAVVTACVGKNYHFFSSDWIQAVLKLERKPDEVIIATDLITHDFDAGLIQYVPAPKKSKSGHWAFAVNEAIAASTADWICKVDVDDIILPHALNGVDSCEADVYCFGIEIDGKSQHANPENILKQDDPQIFSNSVYRRWVWEANPYEDMFYEDGVFWYAAAIEGATFAISKTIDYVYGNHSNQTTKRVNHLECMENMHRRRAEMLDARTRE
jgi:hypothetical protein